jgi:secreted Zn-dependent insulinase-like peptidase
MPPCKVLRYQQGQPQLDLMFTFNLSDYKSKPLEQLCSILNHRGARSINEFFLKKEFLSGPIRTSLQLKLGKQIFKISFDLTQQGADKIQNILESFFLFIQLVIQKGNKIEFFNQ